MTKKLLALLGSPHENGSTAAMLNCAIEAAARVGWEVHKVDLYQKKIAFCRGCGGCQKLKDCIIKDDLQEITDWLRNCDAVVLAAPTYWANVPAVVKNFFDRSYGTVMEETSTFPKARLSAKQKYLLLTACNTPSPFSWIFGQSRGSLRAMNEFFKTSGMKCLGKVTYAKAEGKNDLPAAIRNKIYKYWK